MGKALTDAEARQVELIAQIIAVIQERFNRGACVAVMPGERLIDRV